MIKISYTCDTCGTTHTHTFDTWDGAYNYCSAQDRRMTSTHEMPRLDWPITKTETGRKSDYDSTNS